MTTSWNKVVVGIFSRKVWLIGTALAFLLMQLRTYTVYSAADEKWTDG